MELDTYEPIYALIRLIPRGKVVTYGQAADGVATGRFTARMAGAAMRVAPADVPWHRVVGAGGKLPIAGRSIEMMLEQKRLLESEGVVFTGEKSNIVDMRSSEWMPESGD